MYVRVQYVCTTCTVSSRELCMMIQSYWNNKKLQKYKVWSKLQKKSNHKFNVLWLLVNLNQWVWSENSFYCFYWLHLFFFLFPDSLFVLKDKFTISQKTSVRTSKLVFTGFTGFCSFWNLKSEPSQQDSGSMWTWLLDYRSLYITLILILVLVLRLSRLQIVSASCRTDPPSPRSLPARFFSPSLLAASSLSPAADKLFPQHRTEQKPGRVPSPGATEQ